MPKKALRLGSIPMTGMFQNYGSMKGYNVGLQWVKSVNFRFSPFAHETASARDFLSVLKGNRWKSTNPGCVISHDLLLPSSTEKPSINIVYTNGFTEKFHASMQPGQIYERIKHMTLYLDGSGVPPMFRVKEEDSDDEVDED